MPDIQSVQKGGNTEKRGQRQPNKRRWVISVTTAKELLFLNKSEIKGYGVTYPVRGRILESANARPYSTASAPHRTMHA
jgi:hypothetical protein